MWNPIKNLAGAQTLAQAIINTIPEPLIVLDERFHVLAASRSFYRIFKVDPEPDPRPAAVPASAKGNGIFPRFASCWNDHPGTGGDGRLRGHARFPGPRPRTMLLNALQGDLRRQHEIAILLSFTDVTERRAVEQDKEDLLGGAGAARARNTSCFRKWSTASPTASR